MPVRRFNLIFTAQKSGDGSGLGGDSTITNFISAPPARAGDFLILVLFAVAVAITRIILKQFQIAKKLLTASSFKTVNNF